MKITQYLKVPAVFNKFSLPGVQCTRCRKYFDVKFGESKTLEFM